MALRSLFVRERRYVAWTLLLFAQFGLAKAVRPEPYPLLVFPGGASTVKSGADLNTTEYELVAFSTEGRTQKLPLDQVFSDLPAQYRFRVVRRMLDQGLGNDEATHSEARAWFVGRLAALGLHDVDALIVREVDLKLDPAKPQPSRHVVRERTVRWSK